MDTTISFRRGSCARALAFSCLSLWQLTAHANHIVGGFTKGTDTGEGTPVSFTFTMADGQSETWWEFQAYWREVQSGGSLGPYNYLFNWDNGDQPIAVGRSSSGDVMVPSGKTYKFYTAGSWTANNSWNGEALAMTVTGAVYDPATAPFFHHVRFENASAVPVTYEVVKVSSSGATTTLDVVTVPPLTFGTLVKTYQLNQGDHINVVSTLKDYVLSDGNWLSVPDAVTSLTVNKPDGSTYSDADLAAMATNTAKALPPVPGSSPPAPVPPSSTNTIDLKAPSNLPNQAPTTGGPVWTNTANTTSTTGLDKDTFREGVNKILAKQDAQINQQKQAQTTAEKIESYLKNTDEYFGISKKKMTDGDAAVADSESKRALWKGQVGDAITNARTTPTLGKGADATVSGGEWEINWPGVATINLDPMAQGTFGSKMAQMCRAMIAWLAVVLFEWWLWGEFKSLFFTAATLPQARGNTVLGSGGQLTALGAAAIIVAIVVSLPGLFWAAADSGLTYDMNTNIMDAVDAPSGSRYLFTLFVPTGTLATVFAQMFIVRKAALVLVGGAAAAIRAVIP